MKVCEVLDSVDKLVENPYYLIERADGTGSRFMSDDPLAVRYCLVGACFVAARITLDGAAGYGKLGEANCREVEKVLGVSVCSLTHALRTIPRQEIIDKLKEAGV